MFGKKHEIRLTEKQIKELRQNMTAKERRQFDRDQKKLRKEQARKDNSAFFDGLLIGSLFFDD